MLGAVTFNHALFTESAEYLFCEIWAPDTSSFTEGSEVRMTCLVNDYIPNVIQFPLLSTSFQALYEKKKKKKPTNSFSFLVCI